VQENCAPLREDRCFGGRFEEDGNQMINCDNGLFTNASGEIVSRDENIDYGGC
jgi:hypothetical protein